MSSRRNQSSGRASQEGPVPPPPPRYACGRLGVCDEDPYGLYESREECDRSCRESKWLQPAPLAFYHAIDEAREAAESGTPQQLGRALDELTSLIERGALERTLYSEAGALSPVWTELLRHARPQQAVRIFAALSRRPPGEARLEEEEISRWALAQPHLDAAFFEALARVLAEAHLRPQQLQILFADLDRHLPPEQQQSWSAFLRALRSLFRLFGVSTVQHLPSELIETIVGNVRTGQQGQSPREMADWLRAGLGSIPPTYAARLLAELPPAFWEQYGLTLDDFRAIADEAGKPPGWLAHLPAPAPPAPPVPPHFVESKAR